MAEEEAQPSPPGEQKHWFKPMLLLLALFLVAFIVTVIVVDARRAKEGTDTVASLTAGSDAQASVGALPSVNRSVNPQLETPDDPSIGPAGAPVVVVAFVDFQCPYCQQMFTVFRELAAAYSTRVRFIVRDFPVTQLHPEAQAAAEAAACAHALGGNDKFWAYHDKLYLNQESLGAPAYAALALQVGLDGDDFTRCVESGQTTQEVNTDFLDGIALGVTGTPTFFFNGYRVQGVIAKEKFARVLDLLLTGE